MHVSRPVGLDLFMSRPWMISSSFCDAPGSEYVYTTHIQIQESGTTTSFTCKYKGTHGVHQGCNARKVISEVYASFASFVLQCTVSGR